MELKESNQQYWDNLYQTHDTGWDIGYPSRPLKEYVDQLENKKLSILIPGCGNSYVAEYLLSKGFTDITLVDVSPLLTRTLKTKFSAYPDKQLKIITGDFFDLSGQFDLILEQTFLSALDPSLRKSYVDKMYELLRPHGKLVGVLFSRHFPAGPPFGGSIKEYEDLFKERFEIKTLGPCFNSIEPRKGAEVFINLGPKT